MNRDNFRSPRKGVPTDCQAFVDYLQSCQDSLVPGISVSEWPWQITIPSGGMSLIFIVSDPKGGEYFNYFDCPVEESDPDVYKPLRTISVPGNPIEEGRYTLSVTNPSGEYHEIPSTVLATYDYQKLEILTPTNIQNGEFTVNQDIQGPVTIIMINLDDNVFKEAAINKSFNKGEQLNVSQYLDVQGFHGKNCALIIKDKTGHSVFDEKFLYL